MIDANTRAPMREQRGTLETEFDPGNPNRPRPVLVEFVQADEFETASYSHWGIHGGD